MKKFRDGRFLELIRNVWVLNDVSTSALFLVVIILKIYDLVKYPILGPNKCPATVDNKTEFAMMKKMTLHDFEVSSVWVANKFLFKIAVKIFRLSIHKNNI